MLATVAFDGPAAPELGEAPTLVVAGLEVLAAGALLGAEVATPGIH